MLSYTYDDRDNLKTISDDVGGGSTTTFTYDDADRMTSVAMDFNPKVNFTYDAAGRITYINRTDQSPSFWPQMSQDVNTTISYDDVNRVTGIHHQNANLTTLAQYTFTHNAASELTQEVSSVDGTVGFAYDDTGQLTSATGARSESYSYDLTGNRTMTGYATGTGNRLTSDGTYNYTYDNEGNRTSKTTIATGEVVEYSWDYRNRLVEVVYKDSGGTVVKEADFVYDALDKLIGRVIDPDGAGSASAVETWTLYHGPNAYADFDDAGSLEMRYMHGNAIDMLLARVDPSRNITWYLTDHLGTVRDLADSFGNVISHIEYDSFGNITSETNPSNGDRFKFTGREWEDAVDLYYYRARWYDPAVGRFVTQDPIGFEAGDANLYRYVGNGPTNRVDPSGHESWIPGYAYRQYINSREARKLEAERRRRIASPGGLLGNLPAPVGGTQWLYYVIDSNYPSLSLRELAANYDLIIPDPLPLDRTSVTSVMGGTFRIVDTLAEGAYIGPGGCGPCVGLILTTPSPTDGAPARVTVAHFTSAEDIYASFATLGPIPSGTTAILNGATTQQCQT